MDGAEKIAAGEFTARLVRWASTPIKGTPKLLQKVRTKAELDALERGIRTGADTYITNPIRRWLKKARLDSAISGVLTPFKGQQRAKEIADKTIETIAQKPHVGLGMLAPVPGALPAAVGLDKIRNSFLSHTPGLPLSGIKIAEVRPYQQQTQWTCSAACLKAVLAHYGLRVTELAAIVAVGARPNKGAECNQIAEAARKFGFMSFEYSFESIAQAKVLLDQDIPIICDIQSFNHPGKGHYVVMTAADGKHVQLMDPNTPGNLRVISAAEMTARWWDRAMKAPHELMPKWGIIILPKELA